MRALGNVVGDGVGQLHDLPNLARARIRHQIRTAPYLDMRSSHAAPQG
jgi:hypothetical protein